MRIDKYIKLTRIIKRRTLVKTLADNDRLLINGKIAKPSSKVAIGDEITILFGNKEVVLRIKDIIESTKKEDAPLMYELVSEKRVQIDNLVDDE